MNRRVLTGVAIVIIGFLVIVVSFLILFLISLSLDIDREIDRTNPEIGFGVLIPLFIFGIGILTGLILLWYYYPEIRPGKMRQDKKLPGQHPLEIVKYISTDDEVKVIEAIEQMEHGAYQFEIASLSDLHRMKVHRVVKRLIERDILYSEYFDDNKKNRKIFLSSWVIKKES